MFVEFWDEEGHEFILVKASAVAAVFCNEDGCAYVHMGEATSGGLGIPGEYEAVLSKIEEAKGKKLLRFSDMDGDPLAIDPAFVVGLMMQEGFTGIMLADEHLDVNESLGDVRAKIEAA